MNHFYTAMIAAIVGAIVGGLLSFATNERNILEARLSQKTKLDALAAQWVEENGKADRQLDLQREQIDNLSKKWDEANSKKDNQLSLMKNNIDEMRKAYLFEQERHRAEIAAVYDMIKSNLKNTASLIAQSQKVAKDERERYSKEQWLGQKAAVSEVLSDYVSAAEMFRAAQITLANAFCNKIDNTRIVTSSSGGINSTAWYPQTNYDCTPKANAESAFNSAKAKFKTSMHMALKKAPPRNHKRIKKLHNVLDVALKSVSSVSDEEYNAAISALRSVIN